MGKNCIRGFFALLLVLVMLVGTQAAAETILAEQNGFSNVKFVDGYYGFCLDSGKAGASIGGAFTKEEPSSFQELKLIFTECFDMVFTYDQDLNTYYITSDTSGKVLQSVVYYMINDPGCTYIWGAQQQVYDKVKAYSGPMIGDSYTLTTKEGLSVTLDFALLTPDKNTVQDFFAYRLTVNKGEAHEHDWSEEWAHDDTHHWHECGEDGCPVTDNSEKDGYSEHTGGEATCKDPAECESCGVPYGELDEENHTGGTEIRDDKAPTASEPGYTGDTYCLGCGEKIKDGEPIDPTHKHDWSEGWAHDDTHHWHECGEDGCPVTDNSEKEGYSEHTGGEATCKDPAECETCKEGYGPKDEDHHTGGTEIRDDKAPTASEPGYTGDTYCLGCGEKIKDGEPIDPTHKHDWSEGWAHDDTHHWHECGEDGCPVTDNSEKDGYSEHTGGEATCKDPAKCESCGVPYGELDEENHAGETEIRDDKAPTASEPGYTGDTYCLGCGEMIEEGEEIPIEHEHDWSEDWTYDETHHWHECDAEYCPVTENSEKEGYSEHTGGEATCKDPAECESCGVPYGELDEENHAGETEIRNDKEATDTEDGYTGDTYCLDCEEMIEEGEVVEAEHGDHEYVDKWENDEDEHWHECGCGSNIHIKEHEFEDGVCVVCKAVEPGFEKELPQTGDSSKLILWAVTALLGACGAVWFGRKVSA